MTQLSRDEMLTRRALSNLRSKHAGPSNYRGWSNSIRTPSAVRALTDDEMRRWGGVGPAILARMQLIRDTWPYGRLARALYGEGFEVEPKVTAAWVGEAETARDQG